MSPAVTPNIIDFSNIISHLQVLEQRTRQLANRISGPVPETTVAATSKEPADECMLNQYHNTISMTHQIGENLDRIESCII